VSADSNVVLGDIHGCHHFLYIYIQVLTLWEIFCLFVCLKKWNLNILFLSFKYGLVMKCIKLSKTKEMN